MYKDIQDLKEDYIFPKSEHAPITRTMLALYAGASGDHNPIHIDIDFLSAVKELYNFHPKRNWLNKAENII